MEENKMSAGYNHRCVKGIHKAAQKAKMTRADLEDAKAEADMNRFIESQERAAKQYWDAAIGW